MMTTENSFQFADVIKMSCAAHRFNNGYYKNHRYVGSGEFEKVANKHIIYYLLSREEMSKMGTYEDSMINFLDKSNISASQEDQDIANDMIEWFKGFSLKALTKKKLTQHEEKIYILLDNVVASYDFGLLAYSPSLYFRHVDKTKLNRSVLSQCTNRTEWVASQGTKFDKLSITLASGIESTQYDNFGYYGITEDGKFVSFWFKTDIRNKIGEKIQIKGKVKDNEYRTFSKTQITETKLHYVKLLEE